MSFSTARANFDLLFDGIVSRLKTASATYPAAEQFEVTPDEYRIDIRRDGAYVFVYLGPVNPMRQRSGGPFSVMEATYFIDVVTRLGGKKPATGDRQTAGEVAAERCRYLIKQVLDAMEFGKSQEYGLPAGSIARREIQRIDPATPEGQQSENVIVAYRISMQFEIAYEPDRQDSVDLDEIRFDAERWQAWYDYGGN